MGLSTIFAIGSFLLPYLIPAAEKLFPKLNNTPTGDQKKDWVTQILMSIASAVQGGTAPSADLRNQLIGALEVVFQDLVSKGVVNNTEPTPVPPASTPVGIELGTLTFTNGALYGVKQFGKSGS